MRSRRAIFIEKHDEAIFLVGNQRHLKQKKEGGEDPKRVRLN